MSSVNYTLGQKGVRLVSSKDAWLIGKNGARRLNPKYKFVGKVDMHMPNLIISASDKRKPSFKGDVSALNSTAKKQIVDHFFDDKGKRNNKTIAYFAIEKKQK